VAVVFEAATLPRIERKANQLAPSTGTGQSLMCWWASAWSDSRWWWDFGYPKAGGAYVPLDPAYPQERLAEVLEDASVPVLLTQQQMRP